jgi:transcriptional regulator with XRE-family HTH domain
MAKRKEISDSTYNYRYRLGQNIARIRKQEIGCTQAEMEDYTGISRAYYGRIELGTHAVTIDMLIKIANAFKMPLYRLFLNENDEPI